MLMVLAAQTDCRTEAFFYDLVDVGREYLSMVPCVASFDAVNAAAPSQLANATQALLQVSSDIDLLMQSHAGFLLGSWLQQARVLGGANDTLADFYEWNGTLAWGGSRAGKRQISLLRVCMQVFFSTFVVYNFFFFLFFFLGGGGAGCQIFSCIKMKKLAARSQRGSLSPIRRPVCRASTTMHASNGGFPLPAGMMAFR